VILRHGRYGEFISCSGYPTCKYIKQNFIGVKCPECKEGELVEKKARKRGNIFYGCSNYPNCEFTSAYKPVAEACPQCASPYLLEKHLKSGSVLICPNNKGRASDEEEQPKVRRKKKPAAAETAAASVVKCDYSRAIPSPPPEAVA
jgi:DNA topoisomerase I